MNTQQSPCCVRVLHTGRVASIVGYYPTEAEASILRMLERTRRDVAHIGSSRGAFGRGTTVRGARGKVLGYIPWIYTGDGWHPVAALGERTKDRMIGRPL